MLADILSRTVSDLLQLIVQIFWTLCVFQPPFGGLRDNVRCSFWVHWKACFAFLSHFLGDLGATDDDHLRLIGKRVMNFVLENKIKF